MKTLFVMAALMSAAAALAQPVFQCVTTEGPKVSVNADANALSLRLMRAGQPDVVVTQPMSRISKSGCRTNEGGYFHKLGFKQGLKVYLLHSSRQKGQKEGFYTLLRPGDETPELQFQCQAASIDDRLAALVHDNQACKSDE